SRAGSWTRSGRVGCGAPPRASSRRLRSRATCSPGACTTNRRGSTRSRCRSPPSLRSRPTATLRSIRSMAARRDFTRESLTAGVRAGEKRALARAITLVENSDPLAYELVQDVYAETGQASGVGKSSLISSLVRHVRDQEQTVGVISVDPSSPFTQGALLGDRIRLADH